MPTQNKIRLNITGHKTSGLNNRQTPFTCSRHR